VATSCGWDGKAAGAAGGGGHPLGGVGGRGIRARASTEPG
jgi:hypothetical protein